MIMKYSVNTSRIKDRLNKVSYYVNTTVQTKFKYMANEIVAEFKRGLRKDSFGLARLSSLTTMMRPGDRPLYTKGGDRSYSDLLYVKEIKNGYSVAKSTKMHKNSKIRLIDLYVVHEFGAKIPLTAKMRAWFAYNHNIYFKKSKTHIVIPARHAVKNAYENVIRRTKDSEFKIKLNKAIVYYVNTADSSKLESLTNEYSKDTE